MCIRRSRFGGGPQRTAKGSASAAICSALILGGCSDVAGPGAADITELPRALTVSERSVVESSNDFGFFLFGHVVAGDARSNVVLSPLSASMALGMALNGANGATYEAMRQTLGFGGLAREEINASYRGLIDLLTGLDPEVDFGVANSLWANEDIPFHEEFFQTVSSTFDARSESLDFDDPATLEAINAWVAGSTRGLIGHIVDTLDPALVMLLVNAVYFDGAWTVRFDPNDTRRQTFTRADGLSVEVAMMSMAGVELPMASGPGYAAVELPYGGQAFSMVVVVPRGGMGARELAAALDGNAWEALVAELAPAKVDLLQIPMLTLSHDQYLNEALQAMGMDVAFHPGADFTRLSPVGDELCLSFVRQKSFVEVDERGTRAAAATAVGIGLVSFTGLIADRPFVFAIRERFSGTILFVGLVGDPTEADPGPEPLTSDCR